MGALNTDGFQPRVLDKVERLLALLAEMQRHPILKGKLAMYGGTAINLFMLGMPRLSVDIDVSYIGSLSKESMLAERPVIECALEEVGRFLGYNVSAKEGGHAGKTFVLRYTSKWGMDHIKIDCIYMNRSPLFPLRLRQYPLLPKLDVLMFDDVELAGGKVKALFDRVKIRDLYDISNLKKYFDGCSDSNGIMHRTLLYYASLSACFPNEFRGRSARFIDRQTELESQLLPMLHSESREPTLTRLMDDTEEFIEKYVVPRDENEHLYVELFSKGDYRPELLFDDQVACNATLNPEAHWKLANLKKMKRNTNM